MFDILVST